MASTRIDASFADLGLLESTAMQYAEQIERGEMTEAEAEDNIKALALGMLRLTCRTEDG